MSIVVYGLRLSPFVHRVKIAARAKGVYDQIDFQMRPEGDAYLEITPLGRVPAMVADGKLIVESLSICWYIDAKFDGPRLAPEEAEDLAHVSMLVRLMELYAGAGLGKLFQLGPAGDPQALSDAFAELNQGLGYLERFIGEGEFAHGDSFTIADAVLAPTMFFVPAICGMVGRTPFEGAPKCAAYLARISEHPAVAPSFAEMTAALQERMAAG
ncbi:MAG: glutathione S-transferase family protein [Pseudomonadota bacterium]